MTEKKAGLTLIGADPKLPFYITGDLYVDDSVNIADEGKDALSFDVAMATAKELVEEHGGEMYVIECRVIRKVQRGKLRVDTIKTKTFRAA